MLKSRNQQGLSLIELLTVLSIIVILTTLTVPLFISLVKQHRLKSSIEELYYTLQYARSEAVKRNTNVYVSFVTGNNWCYGVNSGSSCDCTTAGNCALGASSAPQAQVISLSQTGYGSNYLYFEGSHGAAQSSGSLTMTLFNDVLAVTLNIGLLGNIQMCSTGVSGYSAC